MNPAIIPMGKTFMSTGLPLFAGNDHRVANLDDSTVTFGRKEIDLAEFEMPGLISTREEYGTANFL